MSVSLICIKEGNRLRVKITSIGYLQNANCQFPKDLRLEGRKYSVPIENVKLIATGGKWFYSIKKNITIVDDIIKELPKIFTDENELLCCTCLVNEKSVVFNPCGHYHSCNICCTKIQKCPICRTAINNFIDIKEFA